MGAIFLSHASADSPAAADLAAHLERWGHHSLFLRLPRKLRPEEWPVDGEPPVTCPGLEGPMP